MGFNVEQFEEMVRATLQDLGEKYAKQEAVDLLMLTAAQESHLGHYLYQLGGGPACGVFQMEPSTHTDLYTNYLKFRPAEERAAIRHKSALGSVVADLALNLLYQIVVARLQYWRKPGAIPKPEDFEDRYDYVEALAAYWKEHWNTEEGRGTIKEAVDNYYRYVESA